MGKVYIDAKNIPRKDWVWATATGIPSTTYKALFFPSSIHVQYEFIQKHLLWLQSSTLGTVLSIGDEEN